MINFITFIWRCSLSYIVKKKNFSNLSSKEIFLIFQISVLIWVLKLYMIKCIATVPLITHIRLSITVLNKTEGVHHNRFLIYFACGSHINQYGMHLWLQRKYYFHYRHKSCFCRSLYIRPVFHVGRSFRRWVDISLNFLHNIYSFSKPMFYT